MDQNNVSGIINTNVNVKAKKLTQPHAIRNSSMTNMKNIDINF